MLAGADARSRTQLGVATSFGVTRDVAGELAAHALDLGEGPRDSQMHHAPARGRDALQSCATDDVVCEVVRQGVVRANDPVAFEQFDPGDDVCGCQLGYGGQSIGREAAAPDGEPRNELAPVLVEAIYPLG